MTVLGKILVFVNLLFSLVTAGFIVTVFVTRTNWKAKFDEAANEVKVARAEVVTERDSRQKAVAALQGQIKTAQGETESAKAEAAQKDAELKSERLARRDLQSTSEADKTNTNLQQLELKRLQDERANLMAQIARRDTDLLGLRHDITVFRDKSTASDIAFRSAQTRNEQLLAQLETVNRQLAQFKASGVSGGLASNRTPPPDDVRGRIEELIPGTQLARVSIGTDVGVTRGVTLDIYRLGATPLFLGTIEITNAEPKQAVGRYTLRTDLRSIKLQAGPNGDEVGLLTRGR
jgi:hypothetical protein